MQLFSLYAYHFIYFISIGVCSFASKYMGEIGFTDSQIGLLVSIPTAVALLASPRIGVLGDRTRNKRTLLLAELIVLTIAFVATGMSLTFYPFMACMMVVLTMCNAIQPLASSITLEYCHTSGRAYGPIRLLGTVGYQVGVLIVGIFLRKDLRLLYFLMAGSALLTCAPVSMMPSIPGHQSEGEKVPMTALFRDRKVALLYLIIFIATITSQFYAAFFTKHLGDLGMDNGLVSIIVLVSVLLELPFLAFGDKLYKKLTIWQWLLVGIAVNALRWVAVGLTENPMLILISQFPCVTVLATFEFFPALYLAEHVGEELNTTAQSTLYLCTFGAAKILASLAGGWLSDLFGIQRVFLANGIALAVFALILIVPVARLSGAEKT